MGGKNSKEGEFPLSSKLKAWSSGLHLNHINSKENLSGSCTFTKKRSGSLRMKTKWPVPHVDAVFLPEFRFISGKELEDYEVIHIIAHGAYGNVLKANKVDEGKIYAVKVINKSRVLVEGNGSIQQCKDEVAIQLHAAKSEFFVKLVSYWQSRKKLYLVMEFIPGGELFTIWKLLGAMSECLARFYLAEIALAIDFLHQNGVVYRDLKLENILLDAEGHVKLVDFGLAKWLGQWQRTRTICGTLQYTAPEMLRGQLYTHLVDWWSFGVLGFALMTGHFPLFGARDHMQMRDWVMYHQYGMPDMFSGPTKITFEQLLEKDPYRRLAGVTALQKSPFFQEGIDFGLLERRQVDATRFFTAQDIARIPHNSPLWTWLCQRQADLHRTQESNSASPGPSPSKSAPPTTSNHVCSPPVGRGVRTSCSKLPAPPVPNALPCAHNMAGYNFSAF